MRASDCRNFFKNIRFFIEQIGMLEQKPPRGATRAMLLLSEVANICPQLLKHVLNGHVRLCFFVNRIGLDRRKLVDVGLRAVPVVNTDQCW